MQIYAATSNPGKLREFTGSARAADIEVLALPGLATMPEPVEDAPDFMGNAALKAIAYSILAPSLLVMADDSGLEVDALDGRPGVRSARFADDLGFESSSGLGKDDRNNRCLLSLLQTLGGNPATQPSRSARFVCTIAVARNGIVLHRASGGVEGELLRAPRGDQGFGYDPLFLLPSLGRTMAELAPSEKWEISHRGQAFRSLLRDLRTTSSSAENKVAQLER